MQIKAATGKPAKFKTEALIVTHYEGGKELTAEAAAVDAALDGAVSLLVKDGDVKGKSGETTVLYTMGRIPAERVAVVGLGKYRQATADKIAGAIAAACRTLRSKGIARVAVCVPTGLKDTTNLDVARAVTEGVALGLYTFREYITRKTPDFGDIKQVLLLGKNRRRMTEVIAEGLAVAEAVNWARDLVNEPGNHVTPTVLAEKAQAAAKTYGLKIEVLDQKKIAELGMGGLIGVSQGSQQPPKFIVLTYKGRKADAIDLALVGKGITFDAGGISLKPSANMGDMKGDMAGAASVLAAVVAAARLKLAVNVTALAPATENLPSGSALKPGDIITALNGKTMEILNTDAEGRLILADALSYAVKLGAKKIVDVATLTGACQVALGRITTGAFSNNQAFVNSVLAASKAVGEYTWEMPMFPEYAEAIKGTITDVKNIGDRYGGAITAAKFLENFVGRKPWVHLDIAPTSETDKAKGYLVKGATGIPVRTLVKLLQTVAK
jgi:leucyl aminopeptidase